MPRRDNSHTLTLEEYRAAVEAKNLNALRAAGADLSAHTSMPESQVCGATPCSGDYVCSKHQPKKAV